MQTDVKDVNILVKTVSFLSYNQEEITNKTNHILYNIQNKQDLINNELSISNNFLNIAKADEIQKRTIFAQKTIQLQRAIHQESIALLSGNPVLAASASALVEEVRQEEIITSNQFQKARQNRIKMEKRVEIVNKARHHIERLYENSKREFNSQVSIINNSSEIAKNRLTRANVDLNNYLNSNTNISESYDAKLADVINNRIINVERYLKTLGITELEQLLLDTSKINKVNGKIVAKRNNTFDIVYKDGTGKTNKERMEEGLAPIGTDNKSIELHHLKQKDNGVIIEVTSTEHNENSKVLHRYRSESEINRREFNNWKRKYWQERAKEFER